MPLKTGSTAWQAIDLDELTVARMSGTWRPVSVSLARMPSTVPAKHTMPPCAPAPGPMSPTWSAIAITSGLCSTTSAVFPLPAAAAAAVHPLDVVQMQAYGGFVEDI